MANFPVLLQSFKKSYCQSEEITVTFSLLNFVPSLNDQIGVFQVSDELNKNTEPLCYQYVLDATEKDGTSSVLLKLDFCPKDEQTLYEVRYFTEDKKVLFCSPAFNVNQFDRETSILTIKDGTFSDEDLVLIDKIKPSNILLTAETLNLIHEELESAQNYVLPIEIEKRKAAEQALEVLSRQLADQVDLIADQGKEIIHLKISCDREEVLKECVKEEYENLQDNIETLVNEMEELRLIATNYKIECAELNKKAKEDDEMLLKLKCQVMDEREEFEEEICKIKSSYFLEIQALNNKIDAFDLISRTEVDSLKELHKIEVKRLKKESKLKTKEIENTVNKLIAEKNNLEIKFQKEVENKIILISELEKSIHNLESRVANEASNAGRLENEIKIAENHTKEAIEDAKIFHQNFIDAEKKLQVSQSLLQKYIKDINKLKNSLESCSDAFLDELVTTEANSASKKSSFITINQADKNSQYLSNKAVNDDNLKGYSSSISLHSSKNYTEGYENIDNVANYSSSATDFNSNNRQMLLRELVPLETNDCFQPISVLIDHRRSPIGRHCFNKQGSNLRFSTYPGEIKDHKSSFSKNISDLNRYALERQYQAIRLHRNSLIRENSFLKNTVENLRQDICVLNQTIENLALDAEMKIGMLQVMLRDQNASSAVFTPESFTAENYTNESNMVQSSLSPFASEYTPRLPIFSLPLFVPPPPIGFYEFMTQQFPNDVMFPPSYNFPNMQMAPQNDESDVCEQLTEMGIKISNAQ